MFFLEAHCDNSGGSRFRLYGGCSSCACRLCGGCNTCV